MDGLLQKQMKLIDILAIDSVAKSCALLVELEGETEYRGIVVLERMAWGKDCLEHYLRNLVTQHKENSSRITLLESNSCYYKFKLGLDALNAHDTRMMIIYPATDTHIAKYSQANRVMLKETAEMYERITKPYYTSLNRSDLLWIDNILQGKSEVDQILLKTQTFIILPDLKWDMQDLTGLYLLAIYKRNDLMSIRDLTLQHLPMLIEFRRDMEILLKERFNLALQSVRLYFHYLPTYSHLHIHCVHMMVERPIGTAIGLAHLLDDVIDNLLMDGEYYKRRSMHVSISQSHPLHDLWLTKGMPAN